MTPELIVMLTNNDKTVIDAVEVFESCKDLPVQKWGFKDVGLDKEAMIDLNQKMKAAGKTTYLEVVTYTEEGCLEGAELAGQCGFDYLTGTVYYPSVRAILDKYHLKYYPFAGTVAGSPVALTGSVEEIAKDCVRLMEAGANGIDLTAYRYTEGDPLELLKAVGREIGLDKVTIAGSVGSKERIDEVAVLGCRAFTMGSALFQKKFVKGGTFRENLEWVITYLNENR